MGLTGKLLVLPILLQSLAGGGASAPAQYPSMDALLSDVNAQHEAVAKPENLDFSSYLLHTGEGVFDLSPYWEEPEGDWDGTAAMTAQEVQTDVDALLDILRGIYAPYVYFGGDAAFQAARDGVIADCAAAPALTRDVFVQSLRARLSFLKDGHFAVNGSPLRTPQVPYFCKQAEFLKTADGYLARADGKKVASVDGYPELDGLFRLSLNGAGELVYYPVVLDGFVRNQPDAHPGDLAVHYADGSIQRLTPSPYVSNYEHSDRMVGLRENQGIPVLFARNMYFDEGADEELAALGREFLSYAQTLRDEPVVIVDLRSNGGGNAVLPLKWLSTLAGEQVGANHVSLTRWSEEELRAYGGETENPYRVSYDSMMRYEGYETVTDEYMVGNTYPDVFVPRDKLLIILTGKNSASAAESFVDAAHNLGNTLIIGQNTYGVLTSNAYTTIHLPCSETAIQLGSNLTFFPPDYFEEYRGFLPDIWTDGDAETLAVKMLKRMGY